MADGISGCQNIDLVKSIDDLDLDQCKLSDLSVKDLRRICELVGLSVEDEVFPYLFYDGNIQQITSSTDGVDSHTVQQVRSQEDYVLAAKECLDLREEMEVMFEQDPNQLLDIEKELLEQDPDLLAEIMSDILAKDPKLLSAIEKKIQLEDPKLYQELQVETGDSVDENGFGSVLKSLKERPDLVADLISQMLTSTPSIFDDADESAAGGLEDYFQMNEEEVDGVEEEEIAAFLKAGNILNNEEL